MMKEVYLSGEVAFDDPSLEELASHWPMIETVPEWGKPCAEYRVTFRGFAGLVCRCQNLSSEMDANIHVSLDGIQATKALIMGGGTPNRSIRFIYFHDSTIDADVDMAEFSAVLSILCPGLNSIEVSDSSGPRWAELQNILMAARHGAASTLLQVMSAHLCFLCVFLTFLIRKSFIQLHEAWRGGGIFTCENDRGLDLET